MAFHLGLRGAQLVVAPRLPELRRLPEHRDLVARVRREAEPLLVEPDELPPVVRPLVERPEDLDDPRLAELKRISDFGKAYERAMMYALLRPRSLREMHDYCRRKKWDPEDCGIIIDKLVQRGYVNDRAFAKSWIENRAINKKFSHSRALLFLRWGLLWLRC